MHIFGLFAASPHPVFVILSRMRRIYTQKQGCGLSASIPQPLGGGNFIEQLPETVIKLQEAPTGPMILLLAC
jgi:hypothetical protein